jgi:hypothetical protein
MPAKAKGRDSGGRTEAPRIADARFSKMQEDPRFLNVPTKKKKVVVDDRFKVCLCRVSQAGGDGRGCRPPGAPSADSAAHLSCSQLTPADAFQRSRARPCSRRTVPLGARP